MQKSGLAIRINDGEAFVRPGDADIRLNPYIASKAGSAMDVVAGQLSDLSRTGARVAGIEDLKNKVIDSFGQGLINAERVINLKIPMWIQGKQVDVDNVKE